MLEGSQVRVYLCSFRISATSSAARSSARNRKGSGMVSHRSICNRTTQRRKNSHTYSEHVRTRAKLTTCPVTYRRNFTDEHCRTGVFRQCRYSKARQTEGIHHAKGTNPEKAHCTTAPHPADSHTN